VTPLCAWNRFWFGPISARPLGAFRIVFGLVTLEHLALLWIDLDHWLTDAGLLRGDASRLVAGPWRPSPLQWVQDPLSVRLFVVFVAVVAVLFTAGWRTRPTAILLYLGLLAIHHRNVLTASGADTLVVILAFYLMLSPCGAACSIDARREARRRGTLAEPLIEPWAQRLIQVQLAAVYVFTAWSKLGGMTWCQGTALHYVLSNEEFRRFTFGLTQWPMAVRVLTLAALAIEFAIPLLLWSRAGRPWAIALGLALHGGIVLMVNIPIFGELMTAGYLTFLSPAELDALLRRLDPRRGRLRQATGSRPGESSRGEARSLWGGMHPLARFRANQK
jgi:hypothetical protein